jgi:hypothetical protein
LSNYCTTFFLNPTVVISISKKDTSFRFVACLTKSSDILKRNFESGFKLLNRGVTGLIDEHVDMMFARRLPRLAMLLRLCGVPENISDRGSRNALEQYP